ncbi:hypothetical protein P8452_52903 [Trifolium repens]|nr:hypothetical protein P8452_52903 [Trifolium repens]
MMKRAAQLPSFFTRAHGPNVNQYVILNDALHNQFEILIQEKDHELYFTRGWNELKNFYRVPFGAWIKLIYLESNRFVMHLTNQFGKDVALPIYNPPHVTTLYRGDVRQYVGVRSGCFPISPTFRHKRQNFKFSIVKQLTAADIDGSMVGSTVNIIILF